MTIRQRLIAGHRVILPGFTLPSFLSVKIVVDLSVVNYNGLDYLVATEANGTLVKFRYFMITLEKCPETLSPLERILWQAVRTEFAGEIVELENTTDVSWAELHTRCPAIARQPMGNLGSTAVDIVLPFVELEDDPLQSSRVGETLLREATSAVNATGAGLSTPLATSHFPRLEAFHLTARDPTVGSLYWSTAEGEVLVLRTKADENRYQLTLEEVPVEHPLHFLFVEMRREGLRVSVLVGFQGLVTLLLVDPASSEQYFAQCLEELSMEQGQQQVA